MNKLFTNQEYENTKSEHVLPLKCKQCNNTFYVKKHYITKIINGSAIGSKLDFCTKRCAFDSKITLMPTNCAQCGASIIRTSKKIKEQKNHFCNHSCSASHSNANKTKGTRVSKLEKWLQSKLPPIFNKVNFIFNDSKTISLELDIYIPELKLAFELNGIFHYEPIFGPTHFSKIVDRDQRKLQSCHEKQIDLCIIDVSSQKYFKEQTAKKYLDIIVNVINQRLNQFASISTVSS